MAKIVQMSDSDGNVYPVSNSSGAGYCKMPDGTLIQWGRLSGITVNLTALGNSGLYGQTYVANNGIVFPIAFANSSYFVTGSFQYSTGNAFPLSVAYNAQATDHCFPSFFDAYARSGNDGRITWLAIGRWK